MVAAPLLAVVISLAGTQLPAGASSGVTLTARINGRSLSGSSETNPIRLYPTRAADIVLTITNNTNRAVHIATVRLAGQVMGLTFFAYNTTVASSVGPGRTVTRAYSLDLLGLKGQATGLIGSSLSVLDSNQNQLASQGLVVDVRGSLASVYGLFGLAVAILTALAFAGVLIGLARHRLPPNRFRRGLRFLVPGIGLGLFLVFTLSATRVFVPQPGKWVPLVVISAAVFYALGYLTPSPEREEELERIEVVVDTTGLVVEPAEVGAGQGPAQLPQPG